jgi:hypothetical protein
MVRIHPPYPGQHADHQCAVSLLMEMAADYFPELRTGSVEIRADVYDNNLDMDLERCEIIHAAAATVADFAAALINGLHGRDCPVREEQDTARRAEHGEHKPIIRSPIQAGQATH